MNQRQFNQESDIVLVRDFIAQLVSKIGQTRVLHIGDWLWQLHLREDKLPAAKENLRIWTDDADQILGFCWYQSGRIEIQVDPAASPAGEIEREMLAWAITRQAIEADGKPSELSVESFEHDTRKIAILTDLGFRVTSEDRYDHFHQDLSLRHIEVPVPAGAAVRAVDMDRDLDDRIAIHREVWHPSKFSTTSYAAVRASPGFIPELDIVAVAPDGTLSAYCICWYDPLNRIGEFEPVGTRERFRRQGYGRAVMFEGLRRLQALGATEAVVFSSATNEGSFGLYSHSGFTVNGQYHSFVRPADQPITS